MTDNSGTLFLGKLNTAETLWAEQMRNFGSSYERALGNFHRVLKAQESADAAAAQKKATLVMLALTIASGSALGLVFGKTAAKSVAADLARDTALDEICKKNMTRTFQALAWVDGNVAANFALGKAWDHLATDVKTNLKKHITAAEIAAKLPAGNVGLTLGPVEYNNDLLIMLGRLKLAVLEHGMSFVKRNDMEGLEKFKKQSPFLQIQPQTVNKEVTASKIELGFWMKYILNRDYITYKRTAYGEMTGKAYTQKMTRPITEAPSSPDYPGNQRNHAGQANIGYNSVGSIVAKRINQLCVTSESGIGRFMDDSYHFWSNNISGAVLMKAEKTLNTLAENNGKAALNRVTQAIPAIQ